MGCMDWINLAQNWDQWWALVNTVMKHRVPQNVRKFLSSWATGGFSTNIQAMQLVWRDRSIKSFIVDVNILDDQGSIPGIGRSYLFDTTTRQTVEPIQPPVPWEPWTLTPSVKRVCRGADPVPKLRLRFYKHLWNNLAKYWFKWSCFHAVTNTCGNVD
jgi:hypothetical protein